MGSKGKTLLHRSKLFPIRVDSNWIKSKVRDSGRWKTSGIAHERQLIPLLSLPLAHMLPLDVNHYTLKKKEMSPFRAASNGMGDTYFQVRVVFLRSALIQIKFLCERNSKEFDRPYQQKVFSCNLLYEETF